MPCLLAIMSASTLLCSFSHARTFPKSSPLDYRIKSVVYNPLDVVEMNTVIGVSTHIELQDDEIYITHVLGDAAAYMFLVKEGRHIFFKPIAELSDSNLIILTNKRTYNIKINYKQSKSSETYQLTFISGSKKDEENKRIIDQQRQQKAFEVERGAYNLEYTMFGDYEISPLNVWDNGEMTFFKFPSNKDLPTVKMVDDDGEEVIVNRNNVGDSSNVVMLHNVAEKWRVRIGNKVLTIYNEKFFENKKDNNTGTVSPVVRRLVKSSED